MTLTLRLDGSTCRTPEQHRAIVAKSGARRVDVLAWPTAERLRHDRHRLGLLVRWRDLVEPPRPVSASPRPWCPIGEAGRPGARTVAAPPVARHRTRYGRRE